jgi:hypothetical protein
VAKQYAGFKIHEDDLINILKLLCPDQIPKDARLIESIMDVNSRDYLMTFTHPEFDPIILGDYINFRRLNLETSNE